AKAALSSTPAEAEHAARTPVASPARATSRQPLWKPAALVTGLATAAALVLAVAFGWNDGNPALPPPATPSAAMPAPVSTPPVLLTARVDVGGTPAFRASDVPSSRAPKPMGTIVRSADGT